MKLLTFVQPLDIVGYFSKHLRSFVLTEFDFKPFANISIALTLIATIFPLTSRDDITRGISSVFGHWHQVILRQCMPQSTRPIAVSATILPVLKTFLPISESKGSRETFDSCRSTVFSNPSGSWVSQFPFFNRRSSFISILLCPLLRVLVCFSFVIFIPFALEYLSFVDTLCSISFVVHFIFIRVSLIIEPLFCLNSLCVFSVVVSFLCVNLIFILGSMVAPRYFGLFGLSVFLIEAAIALTTRLTKPVTLIPVEMFLCERLKLLTLGASFENLRDIQHLAPRLVLARHNTGSQGGDETAFSGISLDCLRIIPQNGGSYYAR